MLVYRLTNTINGKVYIGKWVRDTVDLRWQLHVSSAKHDSPYYIHRALRKYGSENFKVEVIHRAKTADELSKMETFFIVLHQSFKSENGYNMTMGGEGQVGRKNSAASIRQQSASLKKTIADSPALQKLLVAGGRAHLGLKRSPETCARIKASKQGYVPVAAKNRDLITGRFERAAC